MWLYSCHHFYFSIHSETACSQKVRTTTISGKGTKLGIMQCLEDIDNKILGPNGKKDSGGPMDNENIFSGFLDGYNEALKEETYYRQYIYGLELLLVVLILFLSYYFIAMAFLFTRE